MAIRRFERRCCKMATGTGKSTVAGMLAAWSILNKDADRRRTVFRYRADRLPERDDPPPAGRTRSAHGEASLYRTRDLVPPAMMPDLAEDGC